MEPVHNELLFLVREPSPGGHDAGVTDGVNKMSAAVHVSGGDVMESAQEDLLDALLDEL